MQTITNNLTQAVECWHRDDQSGQLVWSSGTYADNYELENSRSNLRFDKGKGAVGKAWEEGSPQIASAKDESIDGNEVTHLIAVPSMQGDLCRGVTSFLCSQEDNRKGAFEIWRPNERGELGLSESWHANLKHFGLISQYVKFPRRAGLPGNVWNNRFPQVMGSLGTSQTFVRIAGAKADGLTTAIGLPVMKSAREIDSVLLMISTIQNPIAEVMEVWAMDPETQKLKVVSADYGPHVDLASMSRKLRLSPGEGIAGKVFAEQVPFITSDVPTLDHQRRLPDDADRFDWGLGLPMFVGEQLTGIVTLIQ